jgi:DNA invertase Pin-like site-specific DNA recombinase
MSKKVSIDVDEDQQQQVLQFLEMLNIGGKDNKKGKKQSKDDVEPEDEFLLDPKYIVNKVLSHKIDKDGKYVFEIKFKGYPDSEWIEDDLTDCEDLIQKYKAIQTVYAFCRVSSAGQIGEDHVSLDAQCDKLKEIAAEKYPGLRLKTFKISASAYKKIPQVLKSIGEAATRGSHIIVYRVDRLSRNIFQSMQWLENLSYKNVGVHSFVGGKSYADDKLGFVQAILDAQKESALIGDRVKMSIAKRKERGDEAIGSVPYGKKLERVEGGRLKVVDDDRANSVISWIKKSKLSLKSIANTLNKNGKKKRGHYWTVKMVNKYKK